MDSVVKWGTWIVDNVFTEWTLAQKLVIGLFMFFGVLHVAAGEGWIKGVSGYAKQSDFYDFRLTLLNESHVKSQQRLCEMMKIDNNRDATTYASQKRTDIQDEIKKLTGEYPQLPTCKELGVR